MILYYPIVHWLRQFLCMVGFADYSIARLPCLVQIIFNHESAYKGQAMTSVRFNRRAIHVDYASQLYQPLQSGNLTRIENLFKTFTKKIPEIRELNYWERLIKLKMNSQQRRFERYRMIYVWKIIEGHVPNPRIVTFKQNRKGCLVKIPPLCRRASARVKALREASLNIHGAR